MLTIDGARGEGGGQILRTALALSLCRGVPFEIVRIRARRAHPGMERQHVAAVRAAAEVGGAKVDGAERGSQRLAFVPGGVRAGTYRFDIGTAGSAVLVAQTVLPALLTADGPSEVTVTGGTHNPLAPPYPFLERAFLPLIRRLGPGVAATLEQPGFVPRGGGRLTVRVTPCPCLTPFDLWERGPVREVTAQAVVAGLPRHIAVRELRAVADALALPPEALHPAEAPSDAGPGNAVWVIVRSAHVTEVFTAFGRRGVPAERVGADAARPAARYLASSAAVAEHLADQLLLPLALAGGGGFTTLAPPSRHARSAADVITAMTGARIAFEPAEGGLVRVRVNPRAGPAGSTGPGPGPG